MASPALAPQQPRRLPIDQAFTEIAAHVRNGLDSLGIRWTDQAEQATVCTILIQAGKCGWLLPWNPPQPKNAQALPLSRPPAQSAGEIGPVLAENPPRPQEPPKPIPFPQFPRTPEPQPAPTRPAASFPVMIRAFREIEAELPPEVFAAVLAWYGVAVPEDFRPEQVSQAAAYYIALKMARDQYRVDQQVTVEHFEATEDTWR